MPSPRSLLRPARAAALLTGAVVVAVTLVTGGLPTTGASFTAQTSVAVAAVRTASLAPVEGEAAHDATGVATVSWASPPVRPGVTPVYTVQRTLGTTTTTIAPDLDTTDGEVSLTDDLTVPADLMGKQLSHLSLGNRYACVVADGTIYCWGSNGYGQLGDGTTSGRDIPTRVSTSGVLSGKTITDLSAGSSHACAVADGAVYCWGFGYGLGTGSTDNSSVPVAVDTTGVLADKTVTAVSSGGSFSCALAAGQVYCWGSNANGRLGNGSTTTSYLPVAVDTTGVLAGKTVTAISAGSGQACALADTKAYCWGYNGDGALGDATTTTRTAPVAVGGALSGGGVSALAVGNGHACAIASGSLYCWGWNSWAQLGDGTTTSRTTPVLVGGALAGTTVSSVSAGDVGTCAIADGTPYCWGAAYLGNGTNTTSHTPKAPDTTGVLAGRPSTEIGAGPSMVCVIAELLACWGENNEGELGDGGQTRPRALRPVRAGDGGHGLTYPTCPTDWLVVEELCAPGPDVPVSYRVGYTKAGWSAPEADLTAGWSDS